MNEAPTKDDELVDRSVEPVRDVLRALRDEVPSDDSRRATLAALGLASSSIPAAAPDDSQAQFEGFSSVQSIRRGSKDASKSNFLIWVLFGLALGAVLALLLRAASI